VYSPAGAGRLAALVGGGAAAVTKLRWVTAGPPAAGAAAAAAAPPPDFSLSRLVRGLPQSVAADGVTGRGRWTAFLNDTVTRLVPAAAASAAAAEPLDGALNVTLLLPPGGASAPPPPLLAGAEYALHCLVRNASTGAGVSDLAVFLGAHAHVVLVREGLTHFAHTHAEAVAAPDAAAAEAAGGAHDAHAAGGAAMVSSIGPFLRMHVTFPLPGQYKLMVQMQRGERFYFTDFALSVDA
jgi:hypothetical protein